MQLNSMAMKISEKNWSVAIAILGPKISRVPPADTYGKFVVINTFAVPGRLIYSGSGGRNFFREVSLHNSVFDAEDFHVMFDYDKRVKNLESFFEVTQIAEFPIKIHPDQRLDAAIQNLNEVWNEE